MEEGEHIRFPFLGRGNKVGKSFRELAKELEVHPDTVRNKRRKRGIHGAGMTEEQEESIRQEIIEGKQRKERHDIMAEEARKKGKSFKPSVRRIDTKDTSSVPDMLQDCKEQYVKNEILIQKLQYEIDQYDSLMISNNNGSLSLLPQLASLERYQKVNISLRTQIANLEEVLGKITESEDDDPFE